MIETITIELPLWVLIVNIACCIGVVVWLVRSLVNRAKLRKTFNKKWNGYDEV